MNTSFLGNVVGLTASFMCFVGSIGIGLFAAFLAYEVHLAFALVGLLIPVWIALMIAVMEWSYDL